MRYFIRLSYSGASFCGWQIQSNAPSVQQELQRALSIVCKEEISVTGAGRTDTGVSALHYIAHFDTAARLDENAGQVIYKLNAILPRSVAVENLAVVADDAHARFDASSRLYRYRLHTGKDPFATCSLNWDRPLDLEAMNAAALRILGRRDFSCFEKTGSDNRTSLCTVTSAFWQEETTPEAQPDRVRRYVFTIKADRFLRNMVRATVGTLLEIGCGKQPPEWIDEVLASGSRSAAGQSVPGEPLFLAGIEYPYPIHWLL